MFLLVSFISSVVWIIYNQLFQCTVCSILIRSTVSFCHSLSSCRKQVEGDHISDVYCGDLQPSEQWITFVSKVQGYFKCSVKGQIHQVCFHGCSGSEGEVHRDRCHFTSAQSCGSQRSAAPASLSAWGRTGTWSCSPLGVSRGRSHQFQLEVGREITRKVKEDCLTYLFVIC